VGDPDDLARVLRRFVDEPGLLDELRRDFPHIKTIAENARETEFRYRALCCRRRDARETLLVEREGIETAGRVDPCEVQGASLLLLRPGAAADYDVELVGPGRRTVRVDVFTLAAESHLRLGGTLSLDGRPLGAIEPFTSNGEDATRDVSFEVDFPAGARRLRLEAPRKLHLRVARVAVSERTGDAT
jgi:hypothetical protein